ncbi:hypothetical protein RxyAA322_20600 [Rubrobacter xylanophilus]|uniref:Peptidase S9 prolyl oligopeptidase catalytic domain-containing protein n=1 Tax=Rubrobacter xylanophilus TaxID=49319 RepID=A0A510HJL3_9ACTN|nr:S9 family peptidase [Rubrobacter xylanophilus]BBL80206.1 hypothetical protein RxyAA322_20600 [Rubrobacter xylanophilus]
MAEDFLEELLSVPGLSQPLVSPNGTRVAWSWSRLGPAADVFVAPLDGSRPPLRLTETPEDTFPVSWTPDGEGLVVRQDAAGDERARLFLVRRPGVMEPLTDPQPNFYLRGGQLHPNGRWLVYGANLDPDTGEEAEPTVVYRHDLTTGELRALALPERGGFCSPELNRRGDRVLYQRHDEHPAGQQIWVVDIEGTEDRKVLDFGPSSKVEATWLPDGHGILFTAETGGIRRPGILQNAGRIRWLGGGEAVERALAAPDGTAVLLEAAGGRTRARILDPSSGRGETIETNPGSFVPLARARGGWAGIHREARTPADLVLLDPRGEMHSLTRLWERTSLRPERLVPAEDLSWRSVDGLTVHGWLYRTPREAKGAVVLVHGGPTSRSEDRFDPLVQYLLSRGFNVLCPNYRGSTGYGLAFQEKIKEDGWGGREQEDIRTGIEALISAGLATPGRIGITGTSYGGYSAWCAITRYPPELVAAAAPVCGMTDLTLDYRTTRPDLRPYSEEMLGGPPEKIPHRYRERSPINFVGNIRGRLLVVQGMRDPNVSPENLRAVLRELEHHRIPHELLTFEDEGHGILRPKNQRTLYRRLADFFERAFDDA